MLYYLAQGFDAMIQVCFQASPDSLPHSSTGFLMSFKEKGCLRNTSKENVNLCSIFSC